MGDQAERVFCFDISSHVCRQSEVPLRIAALQLVAAVVGGLGGGDRNSLGVQADALKAVSRVAKENADSKSRLAVAGADCSHTHYVGGLCPES